MSRIAYLVSQYPAINQNYVLQEIQHLRRLGFDIRVASIRKPDRPAVLLTPEEREELPTTYYIKSLSPLRVLGAQVGGFLSHPVGYLRGLVYSIRLGAPGLRGILYHVFYFVEAVILGRWMEANALSHVHVNFSSTVGMLALRVFRITMSFAVYGYGELHNPHQYHLAEKVAAAKFVRPISKHSRSMLMLNCPRDEWDKLEYVPLGVEPHDLRPRPFRENPSPFEIICVGRLASEKGQHVLIQALSRLVHENRSVRLHLVGDGPDRASLEHALVALGLSDSVVFEGWMEQDNLMQLYQRADVAAQASLYEGIPIVLMEAMAMEIPCVAPCITGIPELIQDEVNGLLFSPADADQLARAVARLMDSPKLRKDLGTKARVKVLTEYNLAENTRHFARVLSKRLDDPNATSGSAGGGQTT